MRTVRENLLALKALIEKTPEHGVYLDSITEECGSIHCVVGWAAHSGLFINEGHGLMLNENSWIVNRHGHTLEHFSSQLNEIFGHDSEHMFGPFASVCDKDLGLITDDEGENANMTHKEIALKRIDRQLELYP